MSEIRIQQSIKVGEAKAKQLNPKKEDLKPEIQAQSPVLNQKSADEVLDFLSNSSAISANKSNQAKGKKIEVSKYVNPEQAARIGESVTKFFAGMEKHVEKAMKELNLTATQAQNLAVLQFNQQLDDEKFAIIASGEHLILS